MLATGCGEIDYRPQTTYDEVIDITEKQVVNGQRVEVKQEGRLLHVKVKQICDLVEDREVRHITERKTDENVIVEALLMGLATAPITTGAVVLYDSQFVYDNDTTGRLYNGTGQGGARAGAIASLVAGTGMFVGGLVSLIRRTKPKVTDTIQHEDGDVLAVNQRCSSALGKASMQVSGLLDNNQSVNLGTTNVRGELTVDLVRQIPATHFNTISPPLSLQVQVGSDMYGLIDLEAVSAAHAERRERAWSNAEAEPCDVERTAPACAGVQQFASTFPNGPHSAEAQQLLANIGQPRVEGPVKGKRRGNTVATPTCADRCFVKCERDQNCAAACVKEQCR